jgi:hypothetical protein
MYGCRVLATAIGLKSSDDGQFGMKKAESIFGPHWIGRNILLLVIAAGLVTGNISVCGAENASNPLASVDNTDFRYQYFDLDGSDRSDYWVDGAYMLTPKLKLKYELHYWDTDVTGSSESDFETFHLKPIYFPAQGEWGSWKYKLAVGAEWIVGFGNEDQGIGSGSDQIAPLVGVALVKGDLVVIPLVQHFVSYDGPDVSTTAFRLIAIQSYPDNYWGKLDAKVPIEWDNDNAVPATAEAQFGKMFTPAFGAYVDGLAGIGGDRPYDWGVGVGLRFNY